MHQPGHFAADFPQAQQAAEQSSQKRDDQQGKLDMPFGSIIGTVMALETPHQLWRLTMPRYESSGGTIPASPSQ